jgi:serine/threonine protein phosphatase PrpC
VQPTDLFLILASDGVWEFINNDEVRVKVRVRVIGSGSGLG